MASNEKHFDALKYVQRSRELGVDQELAEYQAQQLENVIDIASTAAKKNLDARELVTNIDLFKAETAIKADTQLVRTELHHTAAELKTEIHTVRTELKTEIQEVRTELKAEIQEVRTELKAEIQEVKTELKTEIQQVRTELKTEIQEVRTELKGDIKDLRYDTLKFTIWTGVGVVFSIAILFAKGFHWI